MNKLKSISGFLIQSVIAGLALAFVLLFLWPSLRDRIIPPVELPPETVISAAVSYADAVDRTAPSVVSIYTLRVEELEISPQLQKLLRRNYISRARQDMGSGVLVSED